MKAYSLILAIIFLIYSLYSIIFSMIICCFFFKYPFLKKKYGSFILMISFLEIVSFLTTTITCCYYIIYRQPLSGDMPIFCETLGFILSISDILKNLMVLLISLFCYLEICHDKNPLKYIKTAFIITFVVSAIFASLPFYSGMDGQHYGNSDDIQCWFIEQKTALLVIYLPLVLIFLVSVFMMTLCLKKFKQSPNPHSTYLLKLFVFPFLLFISYIVPLIRRLNQVLGGEDTESLVYLMYIFLAMHGVFNAIFYIYINEFVRKKLKSIILCKPNRQPFLDNDFTNRDSIYNSMME